MTVRRFRLTAGLTGCRFPRSSYGLTGGLPIWAGLYGPSLNRLTLADGNGSYSFGCVEQTVKAKRNWGGHADHMLNGTWRKTETMPRRVIVEFAPAEFERLDKACGRIAPADFLRLVALRVAQCENAQQ